MKRRFSSISITLAALLLLSSCAAPGEDAAPSTSPATTTATTTTATTTTTADRDTLMWAKYKDQAEPFYTINDISLDKFFEPCKDAYVLFVIDFKAPGNALTKETIGEYEFRYSNTLSLSVYHNGEFTSLENAYTSGIISDDELQTVWEAYKTKFPGRYESDEW